MYCLCKCVLYYCQRVTTQLQLTNISYIKTSQKGLKRGRDGFAAQVVEVKRISSEYILIWLHTNNTGLYPSLFRQMTSDKAQVHCDRPINKLVKNVQYRWSGKTSYTNTSFQPNLSAKWVCTIQFVIKDSLYFLRFCFCDFPIPFVILYISLLWCHSILYFQITIHFLKVILEYKESWRRRGERKLLSSELYCWFS
jgi:hypothetical protein